MNLLTSLAICGPAAASACAEQRLVYGRDASRLAGTCLAVVWPDVPAQVAELVAWAAAEGGPGPARRGHGPLRRRDPQDSVVVDFSRMNRISRSISRGARCASAPAWCSKPSTARWPRRLGCRSFPAATVRLPSAA